MSLPVSDSNNCDQDREGDQVCSQACIVEDVDHAELPPVQPVRLALCEPRECRVEGTLQDQQGKEREYAQAHHGVETKLSAPPGLLGQVCVLA